MSDEPKKLTEEELDTLVDACTTFGPIQVVPLVAELRRLRDLAKRVQPYFAGLAGDVPRHLEPDVIAALNAELKAEVDRG